mmetsp:Transcript_32460/g.58231  ORF Transcript_32460/g.58231 Transcript_32460/m.58231 type:complete len:226 (+) Transcript_32460:228-905(+)
MRKLFLARLKRRITCNGSAIEKERHVLTLLTRVGARSGARRLAGSTIQAVPLGLCRAAPQFDAATPPGAAGPFPPQTHCAGSHGRCAPPRSLHEAKFDGPARLPGAAVAPKCPLPAESAQPRSLPPPPRNVSQHGRCDRPGSPDAFPRPSRGGSPARGVWQQPTSPTAPSVARKPHASSHSAAGPCQRAPRTPRRHWPGSARVTGGAMAADPVHRKPQASPEPES